VRGLAPLNRFCAYVRSVILLRASLAAALCFSLAATSAAVATVGARQKVLGVADLGQRPSDKDFLSFSLQHGASPVVSLRVVFLGATASLRRRDAGRRLGGAAMGLFRSDLRAPKKHAQSGIAVLIDNHDMRVSLKLGPKPELRIRGNRPSATAEVKPGYSGVDLAFTTNAGRLVLAPKPGCKRSGARYDATLQDGSHVTKTTWTGCATRR